MNTKGHLPIIIGAIVLMATTLGVSRTAAAVDFSKVDRSSKAVTEKAKQSDTDGAEDKPDEEDEAEPDVPAINAAWEFKRANRLASAGAITRSIPHYEKVIQAAPERYILAYFNLAEVYRTKSECRKAVLLYGIYLGMETDKANRADAKKNREICLKGKKSGELSLVVEPAGASIVIDGYRAGAGPKIEKLKLLSGDYGVESSVSEYLTQAVEIEVGEADSIKREITLEKKLFFGMLKIEVNKPGATVKIEPKKLDSKKASAQVHTQSAPLKKPLKLATGKYFIEVTLEDHRRWIRNVEVRRDEVSDVSVTLSPALPRAIR